MYYYFTKQNTIKATGQPINCYVNRGFTPLTDAQVTFMEAHPEASVAEVRACQLWTTPTVEAPTLEEVKAEAIATLSDYSTKTMDRYVTNLQLANAQTSLYLLSKDAAAVTVYTAAKADETIELYNRIGHLCRERYYAAASAANACADIAGVEAVVAEARNFYDNLDNYGEDAE